MILGEDIIIWENGSARNVQIPRQQTALLCTTCAETVMRSLIRAFSDFALDIPYNPAQIEENMAALAAALTDAHRESLARQIAGFEEDMEKYCQ